MLGTFVTAWLRYESHFVHGRDSLVDILKERGLLSESDAVQPLTGKKSCVKLLNNPYVSRPLWPLLSFFFSSRRRHTRFDCDWSSDVCSSDLALEEPLRQIANNAGAEGSVVVEKVRSLPKGQGFDAAKQIGRASCRERV